MDPVKTPTEDRPITTPLGRALDRVVSDVNYARGNEMPYLDKELEAELEAILDFHTAGQLPFRHVAFA